MGHAAVTRLTALGSRLSRWAKAAGGHPDVRLLLEAGGSLAGLLQQTVRAVVVHRTLRLVLPIAWLRVLLEVAGMPLLLDGPLRGRVLGVAKRLQPARMCGAPSAGAQQQDKPIIGSSSLVMPEAPPLLVDVLADAEIPSANTDEPRNRAERREQQRQQAQAKRARRPRR